MKTIIALIFLTFPAMAGDLKLTDGRVLKNPKLIETRSEEAVVEHDGKSGRERATLSLRDLPECPVRREVVQKTIAAAEAAAKAKAMAAEAKQTDQTAVLKRIAGTAGVTKEEADTLLGTTGKLTETGKYIEYTLSGWSLSINYETGRCGQITADALPAGLDVKAALAALGFTGAITDPRNDFFGTGTAFDGRGQTWRLQVTKAENKRDVDILNLFPPVK